MISDRPLLKSIFWLITAVDYGRKRLPRSKYDYLNRSVASQQQRKRLTGSPTMPIDFYHLAKRKLGNLSPTMTSIYHWKKECVREDRDSTQEREYARAWFGAVLTFSGGVQKELTH